MDPQADHSIYRVARLVDLGARACVVARARPGVIGPLDDRNGLHEPLSCTKTCTIEVRLVYGAVSIAWD